MESLPFWHPQKHWNKPRNLTQRPSSSANTLIWFNLCFVFYLGVVNRTFSLYMVPRKDPLRNQGFWGLEEQVGIRKCLNVTQSSGET